MEQWTNEMREFWAQDAREFAIDLGAGVTGARPLNDIGVVLMPGEVVWRETIVSYAVLSSMTHTEWRNGFSGQARSYNVEQRVWRHWGLAPWWVTSNRIVSRFPDGELVGLWWDQFIGCLIDLGSEQVVLDGPDGWRYGFTGPGTPVIAVGAIAHLHGLPALVTHPALAPLRSVAPSTPAS